MILNELVYDSPQRKEVEIVHKNQVPSTPLIQIHYNILNSLLNVLVNVHVLLLNLYIRKTGTDLIRGVTV